MQVSTALPRPGRRSRSGKHHRPAASPLDYEVFKTKVQPILTSPRKGNARCMACHSRGGGNAYLEPMTPGSTTYTEDQSRRNFERVSRLVVPGEPLKSILLTNPLATEAGGSHWHGGGKHWQSQDNPEWQTLAVVGAGPVAASRRRQQREAGAELRSVQDEGAADSDESAQGQRALHGVPLARRRQRVSGADDAREHDVHRGSVAAQLRARIASRRAGRAAEEHPADQSTGDRRRAASHWHGGGKHWQSPDNAEWQTLAAWVRDGR